MALVRHDRSPGAIMSRSRRRPFGNNARHARLANQIARRRMAKARERDELLQERDRNGDCPSCGWITARAICPLCCSAIADQLVLSVPEAVDKRVPELLTSAGGWLPSSKEMG